MMISEKDLGEGGKKTHFGGGGANFDGPYVHCNPDFYTDVWRLGQEV